MLSWTNYVGMYVIPDIALLADTVTDVMLLPVPHTGCLWGFEQVLRNLFASCAESPSRYSCAGCPVLPCGWGLWGACAVMLFWEPSERASIYSSRFPARGKTEKKKTKPWGQVSNSFLCFLLVQLLETLGSITQERKDEVVKKGAVSWFCPLRVSL